MTRRELLLLAALAALTLPVPGAVAQEKPREKPQDEPPEKPPKKPPSKPEDEPDGDDSKKGDDPKKGESGDDEPGKGKQPAEPGGKKKDGDGPKKASPERKQLEAVGVEFRAGKAAALVARMKAGSKLTLEFKARTGKHGARKGPFKRDQAKRVLETWFEKRTIVSLKLNSVSGAVGIFKLTTRAKGQDAKVLTNLHVTLLKDGKRFYLRKIQEK